MVGPCHPTRYMEMPIFVNGAAVPIRTSTNPRDPPNQDQWQVLERTLALAPKRHLNLLAYIQCSKPGCVPSRGGGSNRTLHYIRLSAEAVQARRNRRYSATLLHELGHHVDWRYGAMSWLRQNDRAGFNLLRRTRHRGGGPNGVGEQFADCYMMYMLLRQARITYGFLAQPGAYQGAQADRRFAVLLSVPGVW